jgi:hypothetical protein
MIVEVFPVPVVPQASKSLEKYTLFPQIVNIKNSIFTVALDFGNRSRNSRGLSSARKQSCWIISYWYLHIIWSLISKCMVINYFNSIPINSVNLSYLHWSWILTLLGPILLCLLVSWFEIFCSFNWDLS